MAEAKKKKPAAKSEAKTATATKAKAPAKRRKKKNEQEAGSRGLTADEVWSDLAGAPAAVRELAAAIEAEGGRVLVPYRDPLGWVVLAALPIEVVEPTPQSERAGEERRRSAGGRIAFHGRRRPGGSTLSEPRDPAFRLTREAEVCYIQVN